MTLPALLALLQDAASTAAQTPANSTPPGPDAGAATGGSPLMTVLMMGSIFAIFYFVMIGPERKARKKREAMLKLLSKGDKVMTSGGMFATVAAIQDNEVTLQLDEGVRVRFARSAIQEVLSEKPSVDSAKR